ncbi:MAG: lipoyl(octanoyl) transferase LipB [Pseudobdellovibrionaceae bacterium]
MEYEFSQKPVPYEAALELMETRVAQIGQGLADNLLWALEHPPVYTAGTSAKDSDLVDSRFPVIKTGRGGQYTYHGPGQRVYYVMYNLKEIFQTPDIKCYVWMLEEVLIRTLAAFGITGERREGRVGIWVVDPQSGKENKIAALGVRVRKWVAFHGVSLNVDPDLSHFTGIVPCGIHEHGVTSMAALGIKPAQDEIDRVFARELEAVLAKPQSAACAKS